MLIENILSIAKDIDALPLSDAPTFANNAELEDQYQSNLEDIFVENLTDIGLQDVVITEDNGGYNIDLFFGEGKEITVFLYVDDALKPRIHTYKDDQAFKEDYLPLDFLGHDQKITLKSLEAFPIQFVKDCVKSWFGVMEMPTDESFNTEELSERRIKRINGKRHVLSMKGGKPTWKPLKQDKLGRKDKDKKVGQRLASGAIKKRPSVKQKIARRRNLMKAKLGSAKLKAKRSLKLGKAKGFYKK